MRRREVIAILGGAAATWPLAARAQQPTMPVVGFISSTTPEALSRAMASFRLGLSETGHVEGQNVAIEYRWAQGDYARLQELAFEFVRRKVDVIVASGGIVTARTVQAATTSIPIVFEIGSDPVLDGLVTSMNRPGGNLTGVTLMISLLGAKRVGLLRDMIPSASSFALLFNQNNPNAASNVKEVLDAAHAIGLAVDVFKAGSEADVEAAFTDFLHKRPAALLVASDAVLTSRRDRIIALAAHQAIPTMYGLREWVESGGLISYGTNAPDVFRNVGIYAGRVLKGTAPADLPIMQSTKFELVINLKTAKALNLVLSPGLLAIADEVIE